MTFYDAFTLTRSGYVSIVMEYCSGGSLQVGSFPIEADSRPVPQRCPLMAHASGALVGECEMRGELANARARRVSEMLESPLPLQCWSLGLESGLDNMPYTHIWWWFCGDGFVAQGYGIGG